MDLQFTGLVVRLFAFLEFVEDDSGTAHASFFGLASEDETAQLFDLFEAAPPRRVVAALFGCPDFYHRSGIGPIAAL
jgi:hypothetical protein